MQDIRLKKVQYEFGGETVELVCNMNVLADVEEAFGSIGKALGPGHNLRTSLTFLTAMLNEWEDVNGRPKRYTVESVGRLFPPDRRDDLGEIIMPLAAASFAKEDAKQPQEPGKSAEAQESGEAEKNA